MPNPAQSQFVRGNKANLRRILMAVSDNEPESPTLDFKQNSDQHGPSSKLLESNRENLGKLISAFANTSGGAIIWGVECKDYRANRADPIPNIAEFVQQLNTHTGGITDPAVTGVESFGVVGASDSKSGFAVTLVPESSRKPHQCIASARTRNYWMRVGAKVEHMPHAFVRAQMLERERPKLSVVSCHPQIYRHKEDSLFSLQRVGVFNSGEAVAKHAALAIDARPAGVELIKKAGIGAELDVAVWDKYDSMDSRRPSKLFTLEPNTVVYPGMEVDILTVRYLFKSVETVRFLQLNCLLYCEGFSGITQLMWQPGDFQDSPKQEIDYYPTSLESMV